MAASFMSMHRMKPMSIVIIAAITSRLIILILAVLFNALIDDYDSSEESLVCDGRHSGRIDCLLGGLARWDGVHFLAIASKGYQWESQLAFFPLYPALVSILSTPFQLCLQPTTSRLITAILISNVSFVVAAMALYKLGLKVFSSASSLRSSQLAFTAAILFCINPASVFMSAAYTESLFAALSFSAMVLLEPWRRPRHDHFKSIISSWTGVFLFAMAAATRGNGVICVGFIAFRILRYVTVQSSVLNVLKVLVEGLVMVSVCIAPFIGFQAYAYFRFCRRSDQDRPWCSQTLPYSYGFVQQHYWNNGPFAYWRVSQLPNFMLAAPIVMLSASAIRTYFSEKWTLKRAFAVTLWDDDIYYENVKKRGESKIELPLDSRCSSLQKRSKSDSHSDTRVKPFMENISAKELWMPFRLGDQFVFVVYLLALTCFAIIFMHVQVTTRFLLASCPTLYWFAASCVSDIKIGTSKDSQSSKMFLAQLVIFYFISYYVVGVLLHCNFLPWT